MTVSSSLLSDEKMMGWSESALRRTLRSNVRAEGRAPPTLCGS